MQFFFYISVCKWSLNQPHFSLLSSQSLVTFIISTFDALLWSDAVKIAACERKCSTKWWNENLARNFKRKKCPRNNPRISSFWCIICLKQFLDLISGSDNKVRCSSTTRQENKSVRTLSGSQTTFLADLFCPPVHKSLLTPFLIFLPHKFPPKPYEILFQYFTSLSLISICHPLGLSSLGTATHFKVQDNWFGRDWELSWDLQWG